MFWCPKSTQVSSIQLIESLVSDLDLENKLREREKCWECQLFTNTHDMNSVFDVYASKGKRCRKKCSVVYVIFVCPVPLLLHVGYRYCFLSPSYCVLTWCWLVDYLIIIINELFWSIYCGILCIFYKLS